MSVAVRVVDNVREICLPASMAPTGWFVIAWTHELADGDVLPVTALGHELVLYRSRTGSVHCLDAHCAHLGAHLGFGGRVVDDCLQCPFHGWSWGPDGTNVAVPQGRKSKRTIGSWPVCESNGIVYLWHDVAGGPPRWSMPDLFADLDDGYATGDYWPAGTAGSCHRYDQRTIEPRVVAENIVDPLHFRHVHGTRDVPRLIEHEVTPFSFMTRLQVHSRGKRNIGASQQEDRVTLKQWGPGIAYTRFSGRDNTHLVISVTPINGVQSTVRQTIFVERIEGEESEQLAARFAAVASVLPEDVVIWEHQRFLQPPGLQTEEAHLFRTLRSWVRTFEPAPSTYRRAGRAKGWAASATSCS